MKIKLPRKRITNERELWFAWRPVRTAYGWHWLEFVYRQRLLNEGKMKMFYFEVAV